MKKNVILFSVIILFFIQPDCKGQESYPFHFKVLGQEDDFTGLSEKKTKSLYENLKYLDLGRSSWLSLGGSYRFQLENFVNQEFKREQHQDNFWLLNRLLLHSHLKIGNRFEFYAELNSSTAIDKKDSSPVDKDELSINQLFVKYQFNPSWSGVVGRENIYFGTRRLVDFREGPNVRRSFDLAKIHFDKDRVALTAFFAIPVQLQPKVFDNDYLDFNEVFSGFYATKSFSKQCSLDGYGFYQKDNKVTYNSGTGKERRYSLGTRWFGNKNGFSYNNELVLQWGRFENQNILAYTVSFQGEYRLKSVHCPTVLGLKTEIISGDKNEKDRVLNTFDALYPRGAYFGRVAKFGPSNLIDFHPYCNVEWNNVYFEFDYDLFWRYSKNDGVYGAALQLEYPASNPKRFIAQQLGSVLGINLGNHLNVELETNVIFPGAFLKESNHSATLFHSVITVEAKF